MNRLNSFKNRIKYWYTPLIIGILFIALGVLALFFGRVAYFTLTLIFSLSFLFSGISEIVFSIGNRKRIHNWVWSLLLGILDLIFGVVLLANPAISMLILALYIGFSVMIRSIGGIVFAFDLKKSKAEKWKFLLAAGIVGTVFSLILILNPLFTGRVLVILIGVTLIIGGGFGISLSIILKTVKDFGKHITDKFRKIEEETPETIDIEAEVMED